ncbi:unnamed protein product [Vitrella brassicaformis CCMP3155]|uniref:Histone deacetylase domain-containing protein n=3 Tax=Vitrella brassicaformis TaxID=1169539 RepID=A0A0G4F1J5_VITBC|nr:unnamed protein product [Vitrella brassicaformis CCMP3155]|eukprot:CEM05598.1 unnamed protein product [Vitrella brassicaformis CCMP3155]
MDESADADVPPQQDMDADVGTGEENLMDVEGGGHEQIDTEQPIHDADIELQDQDEEPAAAEGEEPDEHLGEAYSSQLPDQSDTMAGDARGAPGGLLYQDEYEAAAPVDHPSGGVVDEAVQDEQVEDVGEEEHQLPPQPEDVGGEREGYEGQPPDTHEDNEEEELDEDESIEEEEEEISPMDQAAMPPHQPFPGLFPPPPGRRLFGDTASGLTEDDIVRQFLTRDNFDAFHGRELDDMIYSDALEDFERALALPYYQNGMGIAGGGGNRAELPPAKLCLLHAKPKFLRALMRTAVDVVRAAQAGGSGGEGDSDAPAGLDEDILSLEGGYNNIPTITLPLAMAGFEEYRGDVLECLKLLVSFDHPSPSCHARDFLGCTVLHRAAQMGAADIVQFLIEHVDPTIPDHHGNLALDYAIDSRTPGAWMCVKALVTGGGIQVTKAHILRAIERGAWRCLMALLMLFAPREQEMEDQVMDEFREAALHCGHRDEFDYVIDVLQERAAEPGVSIESQVCQLRQDGPLLLGEGNSESGMPTKLRTAIITHPECPKHLQLPEPSDDPNTRFQRIHDTPENATRMEVLVKEQLGVLRTADFQSTVFIGDPPPVRLADILRVHELKYVDSLKKATQQIRDNPRARADFDGDTPLSSHSLNAAMCAAGAVIEAVDQIMDPKTNIRNAFCAIRPPGHHLGPAGANVEDTQDEDLTVGSQGFCLLNNVAIGAAYARAFHWRRGVERIAIVDFDVHHGNGTEVIVRNVRRRVRQHKVSFPVRSGRFVRAQGLMLTEDAFQVWLDETDPYNIFFASIHVYDPLMSFYPGTGGPTHDLPDAQGGSESVDSPPFGPSPTVINVPLRPLMHCTNINEQQRRPETRRLAGLEEMDAPQQHEGAGGDADEGEDENGGEGAMARRWLEERTKHAFREKVYGFRLHFETKVLQPLREFKPHMIFISAGFDGHKSDDLGGGGRSILSEWDYEWATQKLMTIANEHGNARVVSVLEGGYNTRGNALSPLAQSVAAHVKALMYTPTRRGYSHEVEPDKAEQALKQHQQLVISCSRPTDTPFQYPARVPKRPRAEEMSPRETYPPPPDEKALTGEWALEQLREVLGGPDGRLPSMPFGDMQPEAQPPASKRPRRRSAAACEAYIAKQEHLKRERDAMEQQRPPSAEPPRSEPLGDDFPQANGLEAYYGTGATLAGAEQNGAEDEMAQLHEEGGGGEYDEGGAMAGGMVMGMGAGDDGGEADEEDQDIGEGAAGEEAPDEQEEQIDQTGDNNEQEQYQEEHEYDEEEETDVVVKDDHDAIDQPLVPPSPFPSPFVSPSAAHHPTDAAAAAAAAEGLRDADNRQNGHL